MNGKSIILIFFIIVCSGCEKKNNSISNRTDEGTVSPKALDLQEQIEKYDEVFVLLFQEEGNFTNSGNREILAFYQSKSSLSYGYISRVYCFICDEANRTILKAIRLKGYGTLPINTKIFDKISKNVLGREILWLGETFGYIGDFNNNGKDELYFYELNSTGTYPRFYEFDNDDFKSILEYAPFTVDIIGAEIANNVVILNIDNEKKILTFENVTGAKPKNVSYILDSNEQIYTFIAATDSRQ